MPKLKLQYFGHLRWKSGSLGKNSDAEKKLKTKVEGDGKDDMVQ